MCRLSLRPTAAVCVEAAGRKHAPDTLISSINWNHDTGKKLGNRIGTGIPGGDGEGNLVLDDVLKDRSHFWKGVRWRPHLVNDSAGNMGVEGGHNFFTAIKRPEGIVAIKDY